MNNFWGIAINSIISVAVSSGIAYLLVKEASHVLTDRLSKRYEKKLSEELEKYKAILDRQIYISQKHFDLKLSIYKELMGVVMDMTQAIYLLFPPADELPEDIKEQKEIWIQRYKDAAQKYNASADVIFKNAPFVEVEIYNFVSRLRSKCLVQLYRFESYRLGKDDEDHIKREEHIEAVNGTQEITDMRDQLIKDIRNILDKLQAQIQ